MASHDKYLYCYAFGHAWMPENDSLWYPEWGVGLVLQCERCTTQRRETYTNNTGRLIDRNYAYPDGYQYQTGDLKPTKDMFRMMAVDDIKKQRRNVQLKRVR